VEETTMKIKSKVKAGDTTAHVDIPVGAKDMFAK
jgi:hypothetical protein